LFGVFPDCFDTSLNVSALTSDNRYVTTMLAELMRDAELEDGTTHAASISAASTALPGVERSGCRIRTRCPLDYASGGSPPIAGDDPALITVADWFHLSGARSER
jgi:hypothetical protein